jgi:hypothetical protein
MPETLTATTHVGITRLAGQIGAEITGADTSCWATSRCST